MDKSDLADMILYLKIRIAQGRGSTLKEEKSMLEIIGRHLEDDWDSLAENMKLVDKNAELEDLLSELYDEASYERAGEWVLENKDLQKKVKQIISNK